MTFEELEKRCQNTLDRRPGVGMVNDAFTYARWILLEGTALVAENVELRRQLATLRAEMETRVPHSQDES
jgi:hypothetical protein